MKKFTSRFNLLKTLLLVCFIGQQTSSKAQCFKEGSLVVNGGIGLFSSIGYYSGAKRTPVISLSGEYGFKKLGPGILGLGLAFGYQNVHYTYNSGLYYYKDKWATTLFGIRGTYHPEFLMGDNYELYGVVQLSFDHFGYSFSTNDPYYGYGPYTYGHSSLSSYIRPYLIAGGRYYFSNAFGVFGEIGYDISYMKFGISIKFDNVGKPASK